MTPQNKTETQKTPEEGSPPQRRRKHRHLNTLRDNEAQNNLRQNLRQTDKHSTGKLLPQATQPLNQKHRRKTNKIAVTRLLPKPINHGDDP